METEVERQEGLEKLKAMAYDVLVKLQTLQTELNSINKQISDFQKGTNGQ